MAEKEREEGGGGRKRAEKGEVEKEEKIREKVADSIGGNEFKMADSRLGPRVKWRPDVNSQLLHANMTFLFAIPREL